MPPKNRDDKNKDLQGTNIKAYKKGGKDYYYYIMPDGELKPLVHNDRKSSIEAALYLNTQLRPCRDAVSNIIDNVMRPTLRNPPIVQAINDFREWQREQGYSDSYFYEAGLRLEAWKRRWPHDAIGSFDTFKVSQFLNGLTSKHSAKAHLALFRSFFKFAASNGFETQKPMTDITSITPPKRKRVRHTWEGRQAIYDAAPDWLQIAMNTALYTLQRRSDLTALEIGNQIDLKERTITVKQAKTENYTNSVYIKMVMGDELFETVTRSKFSGINSNRLIKCRQRSTAATRRAKGDAFAVKNDFLTRAYSKVRDEVGVYNHLPKLERPGLHSERALGIWLYSKAGYSDEYIMALSGHATRRMKEHYFEGHEKKKPLIVEAGLSMNQVDMSNIDWETGLSGELIKLVDS